VPTVREANAVVHLLNRATFGPTQALIDRVESIGIEAWIDEQLAGVDDSDLEGFLDRYGILNASAQQINDTDSDDGGREAADQTLQKAVLFRDVFSNNQLLRKVTEFMRDHLSVAVGNDPWGLATVDDRELFRGVDDNGVPLVLGKFADLLVADMKAPSMLQFLNLELSEKEDPNQNYAREILELHTFGADRGYTEVDIEQLSLFLTGFTRNGDREFVYNPDIHYVGPVTILGTTYPNADADGQAAAEEFVQALARRQETALYLAEKLVLTFVSRDVSTTGSLVQNLAQVYLDNDTAIAPVIKALLLSPEFNASVGQLWARPVDRIGGAIRALGLGLRGNPEEDGLLVGIIDYMQHLPYAWPTPDGYPKAMERWMASGGLVAGMNAFTDLVNGGYDQLFTSADDAIQALVIAAGADTAGALVDAVSQLLVFQTLAAADRAAALTYLGLAEGDAVENGADVVRSLAPLLFASPYHNEL
jgi:uncharacterized protein (DUF1800 family)